MSKPIQRPTPEGFTPPPYKHEYVAYNADPYRTGDPATGEAVELRPSVFVREYPEVKVASVERKVSESRGETWEYGYVTFDASSLNVDGYKKNFGASVQVESPAMAILEEAHRRGAPVYAALETVRKPRTKSGESIDPAAYIHDLRGAQKDGNKGNSNTTTDNCKNIVAAVGVAGNPSSIVFTGESRTDPAEWASLRTNKDHTLPPNGWKVSQGGIVRSTAGSAGGSVDVAAVAAAVAQKMSTSRGPVATEGKPWEPLNSDGRVNLSSYMVSKSRFTFESACALLSDRPPSSDGAAFIADAWLLTDLLLWMADTVQSNVTGARPNRSEGSHKEAARWCAVAYQTLPGTPAGDGLAFPESGISDRDVAKAWADRVVAAASGLLSRTAEHAERYIKGDDAPIEQAPSQAPPPSAPNPSPQTAPQTAAVTVSADAGLVAEWEGLLSALGQSGHPERFSPLLIETFGAGVMSQIDAAAFAARLSEWKANPDAFNNSAFDAFNRSAKSSAPS